MIEIDTNFIKNNYSSEYKLYNFIFDDQNLFIPILIRSHYFSTLGIEFIKQAIIYQFKLNYDLTRYNYLNLTNIILSDRYSFDYFKIKSVTLNIINVDKYYLNNIVYIFDFSSRFSLKSFKENYRDLDLVNLREQNIVSLTKISDFNFTSASLTSKFFIFSGYIKDVINPNLISSLGYSIND